MGPTALLPLWRKGCWGIFRPKNPTASAGCEPANMGTKGQHVICRPPKPLNPSSKVKIKVKCTIAQAPRLCTGRTAHRGSRGIALFFHDHGTRRGWGVSVTPRSLFNPWKNSVPIVQEAGWAPGPVWTGAKNLAPTGIRSPDRPARSQSLYWLSYPAHLTL